ncbi:MarR family winged helix-turn-helix transcriptional regulator [Duganella fentianensis]|uniref:MarR family winged helix-turn-helix transcriptional regulator n=1 Tax=Duganella fentianensis TaxID=2692177 RepID=UPI0032B15932
METPDYTPWDSTPDLSARLVTTLGRIASVLRAGMWEQATAHNLTPAQAEILQLLRERTEGVRLSWLAAQLSVSAASASDSVAALVAKQLVYKDRAEDDRRAMALWLTADGKAVAEQLQSALHFADAAAARLDPALQEQMLVGLFKLIAQLQKSERFPALRACLSCRHFELNRYAGTAAPHHCGLVNARLPVAMLRIDCAEQQATDALSEQRNWEQFA